MSFNFKNLDSQTRDLMVQEIKSDLSSKRLYISDNLNPHGVGVYPDLLLRSAQGGTEVTLGHELLGQLNSHEKPRPVGKNRVMATPKMRSNANEMLAEGEFNRFYMRAICMRAILAGAKAVTVYRAKDVTNARSESEAKIGMSISAQALLDDLRKRIGIETHLGIPAGPNSGLSVEL
ncbi:MAG: hypothetical protein JST54_35695 [Deltaproteobacteria bacterium]|nr:hypothetical protein [Deltaproteobacteria bacterium]